MNKNNTTYVCPMHPEVVKDHPGKCPKCGGMDLVPADPDNKNTETTDHTMHEHHDHESMMASPEAASDFLRRFFIVTVLLVPLALFSAPAVSYLGMPDFALRPFLEFGIATVIFFFGLVFFEHAKHEIMARQYGMMTLVSIAVGAGYLFSALATFLPAIEMEFYLEISTLVWVLLFGHFLEAKSSMAAGDALQEVAKLLPKDALRIRSEKSGDTESVPITELRKDDVVIVKPGEKVPADGVIVKGSARFNESHLTGESKPVEKHENDTAVAGSICTDSTVEIRIEKTGESSTIGQIQKLISHAKQTKPSAQRLADKASRLLVFAALGVSLLTLFVWSVIIGEPIVTAATLAITVLVIACPHALGLAIPTVSTIATRLAVSNGVFIKDMGKIEIIKAADYVIFDKTGTLTRGTPELKNIKIMQNVKEATDALQFKLPRNMNIGTYIKSVVYTIENSSSHVIADEVAKKLKNQKGVKELSMKQFENIAGHGVFGVVDGHDVYVGTRKLMVDKDIMMCSELDNDTTAWQESGETVGYVAIDGKHIASFSLADMVKDESKQAVEQLHTLGVKVAMLTGDNEAVAHAVADEIGIDTVFAQVLPEDKFKYVKKLQDEGNVVLMVGDGVNDAPALTQANVGIAVGAGTDVAVESGDVVLTQSNPQHIVRLIILARKVYSKMVQNLWWALGYNIIALPAAAGIFIPLGFQLTPAVGALVMSLSSVVVVVNAVGLRKAKLSIKTT